jgi:uracil-DNA glycosylase family 4
MASDLLLQAYLEAQSDLGIDEVILPYPLSRAVRATAEPVPGAIGSEDAGGRRHASAPAAGEIPGGEPASGPLPGLSGSVPAGESGPSGLFAALERALSPAPTSPVPDEAPKPRPEAIPLPAFADLNAYWTHLETHPGQAAGDPAAPVTRVIRGAGPAGAPLALAGLEPGPADAAGGQAFLGEPGALLAKMLKAIRLDPETCYRTNIVKAARAGRATRRDLARLLPWLHAELALVRAPFVLLLGEACAQAVLKTGKPLEELRQEPFRLEGREFSVTYHPADLLAREELKRKAWEDLQWLQKRMAEGG